MKKFAPATPEQIAAIIEKSRQNPGRTFTYMDADEALVTVKNGESTAHDAPLTTADIEAEDADPSILEMFGDAPDAPLVEPIPVEVKPGVVKTFYIETLSTREAMKLDAQKYQANGRGQRKYDPAGEELRGKANRIHRCVVRNAGTPDTPNWVPLFTMEQIWGADAVMSRKGEIVEPARPGLLDSPREDVKAMLDGLDALVQWKNPSLSPLAQAQALGLVPTPD